MSKNTVQVSRKLKAMVSELKDLRVVRRDYEKLLETLHELGLCAKLNLRKASQSSPASVNKGGPRYRSTNKELLEQYKLLAKKLPVQWIDWLCEDFAWRRVPTHAGFPAISHNLGVRREDLLIPKPWL